MPLTLTILKRRQLYKELLWKTYKKAGISFQNRAVEDAYLKKIIKNRNNDKKTVVAKFSSKAHKAELIYVEKL